MTMSTHTDRHPSDRRTATRRGVGLVIVMALGSVVVWLVSPSPGCGSRRR